MRRALALAQGMLGRTAPNPSVGCVIVRDGQIIAEAATGAGGRPHAEEQALAGIDAQGADIRGADVFVTLEPCAQRSSAALSCSQLLEASGAARVVIAAAESGAGFDAELILAPGESSLSALERAGRAGLTRVWTPRGGALAFALEQAGLLAHD